MRILRSRLWRQDLTEARRRRALLRMLENPNWSIDPERMRERRNRPAIETYPGLFPREMVEEHQRNASARRSEERLYASLRKKGLSDGEIAANLERVRRVIENGARK